MRKANCIIVLLCLFLCACIPTMKIDPKLIKRELIELDLNGCKECQQDCDSFQVNLIAEYGYTNQQKKFENLMKIDLYENNAIITDLTKKQTGKIAYALVRNIDINKRFSPGDSNSWNFITYKMDGYKMAKLPYCVLNKLYKKLVNKEYYKECYDCCYNNDSVQSHTIVSKFDKSIFESFKKLLILPVVQIEVHDIKGRKVKAACYESHTERTVETVKEEYYDILIGTFQSYMPKEKARQEDVFLGLNEKLTKAYVEDLTEYLIAGEQIKLSFMKGLETKGALSPAEKIRKLIAEKKVMPNTGIVVASYEKFVSDFNYGVSSAGGESEVLNIKVAIYDSNQLPTPGTSFYKKEGVGLAKIVSTGGGIIRQDPPSIEVQLSLIVPKYSDKKMLKRFIYNKLNDTILCYAKKQNLEMEHIEIDIESFDSAEVMSISDYDLD